MNSFVIPKPYPKQVEFMKSRSRYTAYGGSRGGGKSFVARLKANMLCLRYDGIQMLFMRRTYPELRGKPHLLPAMRELNGIAESQRARTKAFELSERGTARVRLLPALTATCSSTRARRMTLSFWREVYAVPRERVYHYDRESNRCSGLDGGSSSRRGCTPTCNPGGVGGAWIQAAVHRPRVC